MKALTEWITITTHVPTLLWILIILLGYFVCRDLMRWRRRVKFEKKAQGDMVESEKKMDELYDKLEQNRMDLMQNLVDLDNKLTDVQKKEHGDNDATGT